MTIVEKSNILIPETNNNVEVEHGEDFITIFKNVFPDGYCHHMIKEFDRLVENGAGWVRNKPRHDVEDYALAILPGVHNLEYFQNMNPTEGFFARLQMCFNSYTEKFSFLKSVKLSCSSFKMQRTDPGQGYHIFHCETGNQHDFILYPNRAVVFNLYLNSLDEPGEGGETEFLYQKKRIPPVENTMVMWPATYTHIHRGNAVLGKRSKYVITGWFYYDAE